MHVLWCVSVKRRKLSISSGVGAAALTCTIAVPNVSGPAHDKLALTYVVTMRPVLL